jgi:hypothetical protein
VCKSYPFQIKDKKLVQMSDKMFPVYWDTKGFEAIVKTCLRKDEAEWKF